MHPKASPCDLPVGSRLRSALPRIDYVDSFSVRMRSDGDLIRLYAGILDNLPPAFKRLLVVRSALVRPFGISGVSFDQLSEPIDTRRVYAVGDKLGRWTLFERHPDELITGADDRHLDFRVSVFRERSERVVLSTAVMTHNAFGRLYLATILPFHRFGVATLLARAAAMPRQ